MDDLILKSVIEITRQRDTDSLELSLVTTLAQFVPASAITLYESFGEGPTDAVDEVVRLSITPNGRYGRDYNWSTGKKTITPDDQLRNCLQSSSIVVVETSAGTTLLHYPIFSEHKVRGALALECREDPFSWRPIIEALITVYGNYLTVLNESERDKLTGLLNRRTFDRKLDKLLKAQRDNQVTNKYTSAGSEHRHVDTKSNAWLAMVDIDHFKRINDTYGHLFGDEVLLTLSQKIRRFFRKSDLMFRFGGEEFVIVLEPIPAESAKRTLDRFSQAIASHNFPQIGKITVSVGYAGISETDFPQVVLERADKALYFAKDNGRNCVFNYEELVANGQLKERPSAQSVTLF
ncbi:MAG TPA: GGDEF domain-containing protein [Gammaproteobacteria bacterium]|nr:GGDEF domain-containing protein [Gammaproteobacteria bacterium]